MGCSSTVLDAWRALPCIWQDTSKQYVLDLRDGHSPEEVVNVELHEAVGVCRVRCNGMYR